MSFLRSVLAIIAFTSLVAVFAQPADTVGTRSDTTLIRVVEPFRPDTAIMPADTATAISPSPVEVDTLAGRTSKAGRDTLPWRERHSPRKATILSAVLPGAGQIYNRKYWKAPMVWAGLGITYTFIRDNTAEYRRYRTAYLALVDEDPTTIDEFEGRYSPQQVRDVMDTYQRWRDISYLVIAGVYILNIVDASVDAHFVRFDVSPDLSLRLGPSLPVAAHGALGVSLQLAVR